jgi:hypothetical protein
MIEIASPMPPQRNPFLPMVVRQRRSPLLKAAPQTSRDRQRRRQITSRRKRKTFPRHRPSIQIIFDRRSDRSITGPRGPQIPIVVQAASTLSGAISPAHPDRRSFLKTGAIASTALVAGAALAEEALAAGSIPQGDVDILRLLAAAESSRPISGGNLTFAEFSIRKNQARAGIRASSHR